MTRVPDDPLYDAGSNPPSDDDYYFAGTYPNLELDGPDDVGRGGRLLPSMAADLYFAELLRWFGVSSGNMDYVLPNIRSFWDPASASPPVGFITP